MSLLAATVPCLITSAALPRFCCREWNGYGNVPRHVILSRLRFCIFSSVFVKNTPHAVHQDSHGCGRRMAKRTGAEVFQNTRSEEYVNHAPTGQEDELTISEKKSKAFSPFYGRGKKFGGGVLC